MNKLNESYADDVLKLSEEGKKRLLELDRQFHFLKTRYERERVHFMDVKNVKELADSICLSVAMNKDFGINIEYEDSKFKDPVWVQKIINEAVGLANEFVTLDCYLTKYYVRHLERIISSTNFFHSWMTNEMKYMPSGFLRPSENLYIEALVAVKKFPYKNPEENAKNDRDYMRTFTPEQARARLQKAVDDRGFGWKVKVCDNMVPRMSVRPYKEFRISSSCMFSEVDLQSLEVHEVDVHTARKYWALKTGLYLMLYGLDGCNIYDEGMAIWNSLNKTEKQKPNIMFFITIKIIVLHWLYKTSHLETFKKVKELAGAPNSVIARSMIRAARILSCSQEFFSSSDSDYFDGYMRMKDMSPQERAELLKWNIGPDGLQDLPVLRRFFDLNKFKEIEWEEPEED